jgi:2-polyprenyl-3-methyl-5-hydroxy-6-metoxy-1,4-benzoquinol methylase
MGIYIDKDDQLGLLIEEQSALLHRKLQELPVDSLGLPYYCQEYFKGSHFKRLTFSIQTSAHLLYRSIKSSGKKTEDITIMDYGAGVGTLYTLAKMIGCKTVVYNDHLPDWQLSARIIAESIGVSVDEYIVGDIEDTLTSLEQKNIRCDIITSRNVIEHIYRLDLFYQAISRKQPNAIVYSSTTANYCNPGARIQHWLLHRKWEKVFVKQRAEIITKGFPGLSASEIVKLSQLTRGCEVNEINIAVGRYIKTRQYPVSKDCGSNTCDPSNGVWAENMLPFSSYRKLIDANVYEIRFLAGFWDTHYASSWKNTLTSLLNWLIPTPLGLAIAPFIYVVAIPKQRP